MSLFLKVTVMRKILISLLLAGAAASPAIAGPNNWSDRQQTREDRQQAREDRQQARQERSQSRDESRSERPSFTPQVQRQAPAQQQPQFAGRPQFDRSDRGQQQVDMNAMRANRDAYAAQRGERIEQVQQRFEQRQQDVRAGRDFRQSQQTLPNVMRDRHPLIVSHTPRPGTQPPMPTVSRPTPAPQWSTNWRSNGRYDWQNYRHRHRSLFHLGFYYDPFGWGYYPYQIGWRMWPSYYGSRYWINDPWMYRLPYAPAGYRWVRYWNDAVLIDTWTGTVVDVIPGFFW